MMSKIQLIYQISGERFIIVYPPGADPGFQVRGGGRQTGGSRRPEAPASSCLLAIPKWFRYVSRTPSMISFLRVNNFMTGNYNI